MYIDLNLFFLICSLSTLMSAFGLFQIWLRYKEEKHFRLLLKHSNYINGNYWKVIQIMTQRLRNIHSILQKGEDIDRKELETILALTRKDAIQSVLNIASFRDFSSKEEE